MPTSAKPRMMMSAALAMCICFSYRAPASRRHESQTLQIEGIASAGTPCARPPCGVTYSTCLVFEIKSSSTNGLRFLDERKAGRLSSRREPDGTPAPKARATPRCENTRVPSSRTAHSIPPPLSPNSRSPVCVARRAARYFLPWPTEASTARRPASLRCSGVIDCALALPPLAAPKRAN